MRVATLLTFAAAVTPAAVTARPIPLMSRILLTPRPQSVVYRGQMIPFPPAISVVGLDPGEQGEVETMRDLFGILPGVTCRFGGDAPYKIRFETEAGQPAANVPGMDQSYSLESDSSGITVRSGADAGRFYGAQTLYQLLAFAYHGTDFFKVAEIPAEKDAATERYVPLLTISDHPSYALRSVMVDMGRSTWSVPLLKRLTRIMGQLKLNMLHLHLYDDQMCGFRFSGLPLGIENPYAIDAAELKDLVAYARTRHITVMPEMESWGHVQSIVCHYPELRGAAGMYGGESFGIGEQTYALLEKMYAEVVPCLDDGAAVHVGLDEATWTLLPGSENARETPSKMVGRIYDILMKVAAENHKKITMHLWADHGGRPLPPEIADKVVIEPFYYERSQEPGILTALQKYGGAGKTPVMMGAGASSQADHGAFEATRVWCTEGLKYPNIRGVTLCLWESNDLAGRLVTLYGGADYAWAPGAAPSEKAGSTGEVPAMTMDQDMRRWQNLFPSADPAAIDADRGPEVDSGRFAWPPYAGKLVTPETAAAQP